MRSPTDFIVRPRNGKRYDNIKKIGGIDFITSTSKEDHKSSNRFAEVVSTPISYDGDIKPGDTIVVHHNVFKYYYDMRGRQKSGRSFLKDDLFLIDPYQYYLYDSGDGWKCDDRFCFVKPIPKQDFYLDVPGKYQPLFGELKYINKKLLSFGLEQGDIVSFKPDSEYEFNIDGDLLYRVSSDWITMKWN